MEKKIRAICEWKHVEILEITIMADHVHMVAIIPPKLAVSELMGILKGKTAIAVLQQQKSLRKKPLGQAQQTPSESTRITNYKKASFRGHIQATTFGGGC